ATVRRYMAAPRRDGGFPGQTAGWATPAACRDSRRPRARNDRGRGPLRPVGMAVRVGKAIAAPFPGGPTFPEGSGTCLRGPNRGRRGGLGGAPAAGRGRRPGGGRPACLAGLSPPVDTLRLTPGAPVSCR